MGILFNSIRAQSPSILSTWKHLKKNNKFSGHGCINEWKELAGVGTANGPKLMGVEAQ